MSRINVLVVEDEKLAREQFINQLKAIDPGIHIAGETASVRHTISWLNDHQADLIFLDIHLGDSSSFEIFNHTQVDTPVIFTTAYDHYALDAFKVNSIDYLLKPIEDEELKVALDKFKKLNTPKAIDWKHLEELIDRKKKIEYRKRFLVKKGQQLASIHVKDIAYFEVDGRYVNLFTKQGNKYLIDHSLTELEGMLDPVSYFKLNRSYITHINAIQNITSLSKSKLKINLSPKSNNDIIVSAERSHLFKSWLNR